jgi:hypothetical protein
VKLPCGVITSTVSPAASSELAKVE